MNIQTTTVIDSEGNVQTLILNQDQVDLHRNLVQAFKNAKPPRLDFRNATYKSIPKLATLFKSRGWSFNNSIRQIAIEAKP